VRCPGLLPLDDGQGIARTFTVRGVAGYQRRDQSAAMFVLRYMAAIVIEAVLTPFLGASAQSQLAARQGGADSQGWRHHLMFWARQVGR